MERSTYLKCVDPQPGDVLYIMPQSVTVTKRNQNYVYFTASPEGAFEAVGKTRVYQWTRTFLWEIQALEAQLKEDATRGYKKP